MMAIRNPDLVRSSCSAHKSSLAWIDEEKLASFAALLPVQEILAFNDSAQGLSTNRFGDEVPFPTAQDEAGFIMVAHALDFGSGFRHALHKHRNGLGAWLTIRAGLVSMGRENPRSEAAFLAGLTEAQIANMFDLHADDLLPLTKQLHTVVHELGTELQKRGFDSAGAFVLNNVGAGASGLVEALVETFPVTFRDEYSVDGQVVAFFKKAQLVVSELNMRFRSEWAEFAFDDIDRLTAFVDNVVVAMMRKEEIVQCQPQLASKIAEGSYLLMGSEEEVALRSAALTAVDRAVCMLRQRGEDRLNDQKLCNWLWGCLGKKPENRSYARHHVPSTLFY